MSRFAIPEDELPESVETVAQPTDRKPWFKFCPSDWLNDLALLSVSREARSVWIDLLCLMHFSPKRGQLLIASRLTPRRHRGTGGTGENHDISVRLSSKPRAISDRNSSDPIDDLAKALRLTRRRTASILEELENANVFSRLPNGTIYSRRMLRDEKVAQIARENGRRGGNPALNPLANPESESEREKKDSVSDSPDSPFASLTSSPTNLSTAQQVVLKVDEQAASAPPLRRVPPLLALVEPPAIDWAKIAFDEGTAWLASRGVGGKTHANRATLVGKWGQVIGDFAVLASLIRKGVAAGVADPVSWMAARETYEAGLRRLKKEKEALRR